MGFAIHRTTKEFHDSVDVNTLDPAAWVRYARTLAGTDAKLAAYQALRAAGVAAKYVKFDGSDNPAEMTSGEKSTVDAAEAAAAAADATAAAQAEKGAAASGIDNGDAKSGDKTERLVRAVALAALDAINTLRSVIPHPCAITRSGTTATVNSVVAHGLAVNDTVVISGADAAAYNGQVTVTATPSGSTFTYTVAGSPASPAAGSIAFTRSVVGALPDITAAQLVTAIKNKISASAE